MIEPPANPKEVVRRGEEIYETRLREKLEAENVGKFVVIDVETGDYEMDESEVAASDRAMARFPDHPRYLKRIGYDVAHTFGGSLIRTAR